MATSYFSRTPASTGNRRTFTFSTWIKKSDATSRFQLLFMGNSYSGSNLNSGIYFNSSNKLNIQTVDNGANAYILTTTQLFRDVSAWYHIVIAIDTTQATDTNRIKLYVNGLQVTAFDTATYPTQNLETAYNQVSIPQVIGHRDSEASNYYFDGLMANTILVDGQQLTPSSFGETDATTGIWKFKGYSGSYGTNGFFLKFENSASLGTDSSGNGNNFTVNGTPTQTVDTPSNVFTTLNSINVTPSGGHTFSNGNTQVTIGVVDAATPATFGVKSGKWYWETKWTQKGGTDRYGVMPDDASNQTAPHVTGIAWNEGSAEMWLLSSSYSGSWGSNPATNDIIMFALDYDNKAFYMGVNGTWRNSGVPTSGASRTGAVNFSSTSLDGKYLLPCVGKGNGGTSTWQMNFGNGYFGSTAISSPYSDGAGLGKFQYQPPTGYYALCTKNINVYG
jgi:hypothetical protein